MWQTCDRCHRESRRLIVSYWGELLCPACCRDAGELFDIKQAWPALPAAWVGGN